MSNKPDNLSSPAHCLCFNLRRATRMVTRNFDYALAETGLTTPQFSVLAVLDGAGPMTMSAFAKTMETERTTLTRNLALLESEGFTTRKTGKDKRVRLIALTARGRRKLTAALPIWRQAQSALVSALGTPASRRLLTTTHAVEASLEHDP